MVDKTTDKFCFTGKCSRLQQQIMPRNVAQFSSEYGTLLLLL